MKSRVKVVMLYRGQNQTTQTGGPAPPVVCFTISMHRCQGISLKLCSVLAIGTDKLSTRALYACDDLLH